MSLEKRRKKKGEPVIIMDEVEEAWQRELIVAESDMENTSFSTLVSKRKEK